MHLIGASHHMRTKKPNPCTCSCTNTSVYRSSSRSLWSQHPSLNIYNLMHVSMNSLRV